MVNRVGFQGLILSLLFPLFIVTGFVFIPLGLFSTPWLAVEYVSRKCVGDSIIFISSCLGDEYKRIEQTTIVPRDFRCGDWWTRYDWLAAFSEGTILTLQRTLTGFGFCTTRNALISYLL